MNLIILTVMTGFAMLIGAAVWELVFPGTRGSWMPVAIGGPLGCGVAMLLFYLAARLLESRSNTPPPPPTGTASSANDVTDLTDVFVMVFFMNLIAICTHVVRSLFDTSLLVTGLIGVPAAYVIGMLALWVFINMGFAVEKIISKISGGGE